MEGNEKMRIILGFVAGMLLGFVATVAAIIIVWLVSPDFFPPVTDYVAYAGLMVLASIWLTRRSFFGPSTALGFIAGGSAWALFGMRSTPVITVAVTTITFAIVHLHAHRRSLKTSA